MRAAAERPAAPFVFAASRDAAERSAAERRRAAEEACRDNAFRDAALCPSRLSASRTARDRVADVFAGRLPCASAFFALRRVLAAAVPFFGAANFTPARRAFERPMAMACLVDVRHACPREHGVSPRARTRQPAWTVPCPGAHPHALAPASSSPACRLPTGCTLSKGTPRATMPRLARCRTLAPQAITDHVRRRPMAAKRFKRGDHVSWNSEAGRVRGNITRVVTAKLRK